MQVGVSCISPDDTSISCNCINRQVWVRHVVLSHWSGTRRGLISLQPVVPPLAGVYLLRHWQLNQQDKYWRMLRQLVLQAQQLQDDTLLDNPYLTVAHMLSVEGHGPM
jgi:hypothetical protein